jgi:NADH:ubiquinone oxidoreductase subunit 5 (subunit L)/multisubunit Na+/H+ antiporter MnhA subunit
MWADVNPAAGHSHLPAFIPDPGGTDVLMTVMTIFLVVAVLVVGNLFLRLHTLPERMAHRTHKLQFEIVAVLGLLALFTHMHIFWVIGLLLAIIDLPDFGTPLRSMAGSLEKLAGVEPYSDGGKDHGTVVEPDAGTAKGATDVVAKHRDGGGEVAEPPVPLDPRRPRPVPAATRDKEMANA